MGTILKVYAALFLPALAKPGLVITYDISSADEHDETLTVWDVQRPVSVGTLDLRRKTTPCLTMWQRHCLRVHLSVKGHKVVGTVPEQGQEQEQGLDQEQELG